MQRLVVSSLALLALVSPSAALAAVACMVAPNPGVEVADTETVAQIVCAELRRQGEQVGEPTYDAAGERWRVGVRPLGRKIFLTLQRVHGDGSIGGEGEILLSEIEETPLAAPRLVEAVLTGKPVASTASVDTLVGDEARKYRKRGGESFFGLGFMGMGVPGTDVMPGGGIVLRWSFETVDFGVLGDLRMAGGAPPTTPPACSPPASGGGGFCRRRVGRPSSASGSAGPFWASTTSATASTAIREAWGAGSSSASRRCGSTSRA